MTNIFGSQNFVLKHIYNNKIKTIDTIEIHLVNKPVNAVKSKSGLSNGYIKTNEFSNGLVWVSLV